MLHQKPLPGIDEQALKDALHNAGSRYVNLLCRAMSVAPKESCKVVWVVNPNESPVVVKTNVFTAMCLSFGCLVGPDREKDIEWVVASLEFKELLINDENLEQISEHFAFLHSAFKSIKADMGRYEHRLVFGYALQLLLEKETYEVYGDLAKQYDQTINGLHGKTKLGERIEQAVAPCVREIALRILEVEAESEI
jgi:hypothetical protein